MAIGAYTARRGRLLLATRCLRRAERSRSDSSRGRGAAALPALFAVSRHCGAGRDAGRDVPVGTKGHGAIYRLAWVASNRQITAPACNCETTQMYRSVERRRVPRHEGAKPAVILLDPDALFECTVRDLSPTGAGLLAPDAAILPAAFDLRFDQVTRHCTVVWRQLYCMGLEFKSKD
jgi:hypothetical protein